VILREGRRRQSRFATSAILRTGRQIAGHRVHAVVRSFQVPATPALRPGRELAVGTDFAGDARHFAGKALSWSTMGERLLQLKDFARHVDVIFFDRSPWRRRSRLRHVADTGRSGLEAIE